MNCDIFLLVTISNCSGNQGWYITPSEKGFTCETDYLKLTILSKERQNFKMDKLEPSQAHMVSVSSTFPLVPTPLNNSSWRSADFLAHLGVLSLPAFAWNMLRRGLARTESPVAPPAFVASLTPSTWLLEFNSCRSEGGGEALPATPPPHLSMPFPMISANLNGHWISVKAHQLATPMCPRCPVDWCP